jgi:radical SAM superfamily enzyme YgiQ (UPF0313 family)
MESNLIKKDLRKVKVKFAICYPGPYRVAMSCLAVHAIYSMLNSRRDVACERAFFQASPSGERTIESNMPLQKMDVLGFSLQYEIDYVNLLRMLVNSHIPPLSKNRNEGDPLIIAGGPCATGNPEPLSDFIDLFAIGESESILPKLVDRLAETKNPRAHLSDLLEVDGLYIPSLSQDSVRRVWLKDLDAAPYPVDQVIPHVDEKSRMSPVFGKTFLAEVTRGCGHGCRFCYIGYIGRPYRERSIGKMEDIIERGIKHTGVSKVSLIGSGLSDYSHLIDLCGWIVDDQKLNLSLSSMRADSPSQELLGILARGGERTLTIAPETGSEALRRSLNKKITDEDIICCAENALEAGLRNIKLYFMVGLPGEREEDIQSLSNLVKRIAKLGYPPRSIRLSITPFVPKPHTPFQWFPQLPLPSLESKIRTVRSILGVEMKVDVEAIDLRWARIEAILSMADRTIGKTLMSVADAGGTIGAWKRALTKFGVPSSSVESILSTQSKLPWDKIDIGVSKDFVIDEKNKAILGEESRSCLEECSKCGIC